MSRARIMVGDCVEQMATLPDRSVHCCVTSPPFWGLRDYGTATWEGGDPDCDHMEVQPQGRPGRETPGGRGGSFPKSERAYRDVCGKCGALRIDRQLGLEATPDEYVANMVRVFREVRRILRDDGVCFANFGDSYAAHPGQRKTTDAAGPKQRSDAGSIGAPSRHVESLKPKDLVGIPWRTAFALQADGWYLRSDIIWSKPNPMPESVTDRPTKSHEYVFLLTKAERYFYDNEAIAEPSSDDSGWSKQRARGDDTWQYGRTAGGNTNNGIGGTAGTPGTRNARTVWTIDDDEWSEFMQFREWKRQQIAVRDTWTIATQPYPEAHFATFPEELPRRCILAGTSQRGCCPECGAPWERVVDTPAVPAELRNRDNGAKMDYHTRQVGSGQKLQDWRDANPSKTVGWRPTCSHYGTPPLPEYPAKPAKPSDRANLAEWERAVEAWEVVCIPIRVERARLCKEWEPLPADPCTVLDPFGGSGTTAAVAVGNGRDAITIDLNPEYVPMMRDRIGPMFVDSEVAV